MGCQHILTNPAEAKALPHEVALALVLSLCIPPRHMLSICLMQTFKYHNRHLLNTPVSMLASSTRTGKIYI